MFATRMHYHISSSAYACFFVGMLNFQFRMSHSVQSQRFCRQILYFFSFRLSPAVFLSLALSLSLSHSLDLSRFLSPFFSVPHSHAHSFSSALRALFLYFLSFLYFSLSLPLYTSHPLFTLLSPVSVSLSLLLCLLCLCSSLSLPSSLFPPPFSPPF